MGIEPTPAVLETAALAVTLLPNIVCRYNGAPNGNRTRNPFRAADFKSAAYASSATGANRKAIKARLGPIQKAK